LLKTNYKLEPIKKGLQDKKWFQVWRN
jgi:hypothetical protein